MNLNHPEQRYNLQHLVDIEKVPSVTALSESRGAASIVRTLTALLKPESLSSIVPTAPAQLAKPPIPVGQATEKDSK